MKINYKDYTIEVINDEHYSLNSADNLTHYDIEYFDEAMNDDRTYPASRRGITISRNSEALTSAILCELWDAASIHNRSFLVHEDNILICCSNKIYSLDLPNLTLHWKKRLDPTT